MTFLAWSFSAADLQDLLGILHIFLPYPAGFLAGWLGYRWIKKAGLQSERFSPAVAAILTAPFFAIAYYVIATAISVGARAAVAAFFMGVLFSPIIVVLAPLLVVYICGGWQGRRLFGVALAGTAVALVISEFVGLYFIFDGME
jgi:hypothetical protein